MKNKLKNSSLVRGRSPFAVWPLLIIITLLVVSGIYFVSRSFAASGSLTLIPATTSVNIGDTVTVAVRANSGTDTVNAVQAILAFDATKLQYISVNDSGSAFSLAAATQAGTGTIDIARATSGGSAPVSGDALVTTVTFKALASGSVPVTLATGSVLLRSTDNIDILVLKNNTTLNLADLTAPTVPVGLSAASTTMTSVNLAWATSTDNVAVTGYRVYRNSVLIGSSATTGYSNTGLQPGTAYIYAISAVDAKGNESAKSITLVSTTLADAAAPTVPGKPTSATQTMTSISLSWTVSTDNVAVTGYRVYRNSVQIATSATNSYIDPGLAVNTTYSYTVSAYDALGNASVQSISSAIKTLADSQAPSIPTNVTSTVTSQTVRLAWAAASDNVAVTSYVIYMDGAQIGVSPATTTTEYIVTNAVTGSHVYTVTAKDAAGNISAPSIGATVVVYAVGDINHDSKIDVFDLSTLLSNWGRTGVATYDLNADSSVNIFDLSILLSHWTG